MLRLRSVRTIRNLHGRRVVLRIDVNVPMERGRIRDDWRLQKVLPTLRYLTDHGAKVLLLAHLGRPDGVEPALSLAPIVEKLSELFGRHIPLLKTNDWNFSDSAKLAFRESFAALSPGAVVCADNIRFSFGEEENDRAFAEFLASLADVFVLDGFAVAHRDSASVTGIARYIPAYAGLLVEEEVRGLSRLLDHPHTPFVVCLGGAKTETKLPLLEAFLPKATSIILGGSLVPELLSVLGYGVNLEPSEKISRAMAKNLRQNEKIIWPIDVVVGDSEGKHPRVVNIKKRPHEICGPGEAVYDVGPETLRALAPRIRAAKTLVWNGAFGYFEVEAYRMGTHTLARLFASVAKGKAFGVVGGGETVEVVHALGLAQDIDLVSTGGGAMLDFLVHTTLPGLTALVDNNMCA